MAGTLAAPGTGAAQTENVRLSVRPREMATGTRTTQGGMFRLDVPSRNLVYVPQQCVGTRRCPLVVNSNAPFQYTFRAADMYGFILLEYDAGRDSAAVANLSRAMQKALRTLAIDPDKIAIVGRCGSGTTTAMYGAQNLDVFSRIVVFTQHTPDTTDLPMKSPNRSNEFYVAGGLVEGGAVFQHVRQVRDRGYPVKYSMQFRGHTFQYEDYEFMGRWLQESWAIPDPAARPKPFAFGAPPLLTSDVIAKLDTFWTRFLQEPDSVRTTARRALVREVVVPAGPERVSTLMVDMAALAARYPSVAADLRAAGLTAEQHDAYRAALVSARIVNANASGHDQSYGKSRVRVEPNSVLAQNVAFMKTHPDDFPVQNSSVAGGRRASRPCGPCRNVRICVRDLSTYVEH